MPGSGPGSPLQSRFPQLGALAADEQRWARTPRPQWDPPSGVQFHVPERSDPTLRDQPVEPLQERCDTPRTSADPSGSLGKIGRVRKNRYEAHAKRARDSEREPPVPVAFDDFGRSHPSRYPSRGAADLTAPDGRVWRVSEFFLSHIVRTADAGDPTTPVPLLFASGTDRRSLESAPTNWADMRIEALVDLLHHTWPRPLLAWSLGGLSDG